MDRGPEGPGIADFDRFFVALLKSQAMEGIKKKYIIDDNKKPVAVQIDIADFERIERILEDYALGQLIKENDPTEAITLNEAKAYYDKLDKEREDTGQ